MKASVADKSGVRLSLRLGDQMLGAAEADFESQIVDRSSEQRLQSGWRGLGEIERELRQQRIEKCGLTRLERVTFAAAKESALRLLPSHSVARS